MVRSDEATRDLVLNTLAVPAFRCRKSDQADGEDIQQMLTKGTLTRVFSFRTS